MCQVSAASERGLNLERNGSLVEVRMLKRVGSSIENHYHIANDEKIKLNIYQWPDKELLDREPAYKVRC
jgi:hypothetical protein